MLNVKKAHGELLENGRVELIGQRNRYMQVTLVAGQFFFLFCVSVGDGRLGYPDVAPYDAIHVGAAAPEVPQAVRNCIPLAPA